jgi:ADP-ribosyl-[dinitrogen reductase] hydrolase
LAPEMPQKTQIHKEEEAVVRAVNDTVAAIVGAAVGALHGTKALPAHWVTNLTGRTKSDDDRKMFAILDRAERAIR